MDGHHIEGTGSGPPWVQSMSAVTEATPPSRTCLAHDVAHYGQQFVGAHVALALRFLLVHPAGARGGKRGFSQATRKCNGGVFSSSGTFELCVCVYE